MQWGGGGGAGEGDSRGNFSHFFVFIYFMVIQGLFLIKKIVVSSRLIETYKNG